MLVATRVSTNKELEQILALQQQNLRGVHTGATEKEQGFLTVAHTPEALQKMHALEPGIIVKDHALLAGYALVMLKECSGMVPELASLFDGLDNIIYRDKTLAQYKFYVMGQICVAAAYRGKGVFDMLYRQHRQSLQGKFDFVITEIATRNTRSMRAHERVGFKTIHIHRDGLDEWAVVLWDWSNNR